MKTFVIACVAALASAQYSQSRNFHTPEYKDKRVQEFASKNSRFNYLKNTF